MEDEGADAVVVEDDLASFREQWKKELGGKSGKGSEKASQEKELKLDEDEEDQEDDVHVKARQFFLQGVKYEESGKLYEAIRFYKKAAEEMRKEKEKDALAAQAALAEKTASERATVARIQFRLPDGSSQTKQFPAESSLSEIYEFVKSGLDTPFSSFSLSTTFPRRMLDQEDKATTLKQLQMAPSATILVLPS